jgi:hypothetical protein
MDPHLLLSDFFERFNAAPIIGHSSSDASHTDVSSLNLYYQDDAGGPQIVLHLQPVIVAGKAHIRLTESSS